MSILEHENGSLIYQTKFLLMFCATEIRIVAGFIKPYRWCDLGGWFHKSHPGLPKSHHPLNAQILSGGKMS